MADETYKIKQVPEDFVVREKSSRTYTGPLKAGDYSIFRMKKKNYTTERAVQAIADALKISRKNIGYAGAKDSAATTEQSISLHHIAKERALGLKLKDISLEYVGQDSEPISLGDLDCNEFEIVVRSITNLPKKVDGIINYYGEQRFSTNNADIGKAILKKEFKKAIEMITTHPGREEGQLKKFLEEKGSDYVGALKKMPWKTLNMYIHAYQSKLWNETAKRLIERHAAGAQANMKVPVIGFATEIEDKELKDIIETVMKEEDIKLQDFVIRAIPDLSSPGTERELYSEVKDLNIGELEEDELNLGKKKVKISFSLGKGSYATEAIKSLFHQS
jgi:tRNA pseudouridine13 synthase